MDNPFDLGSAVSTAWEVFTQNAVALIVGLLLAVIVGMATLGFGLPGLLVGYYKMCLRAVRGESPEVGDVFQGFQFFLPALLVGIVVGLGVMFGFMLLIIPGVILAMMWAWVWFFLADGKEGLGDILSASAEVTKSDWAGVFVLLLVSGIISAAGNIVPLGGLVTGPIATLMSAVAYDKWVKKNAGAAA